MVKQVSGGYLIQDADSAKMTREELKIVTKRQPTDQEITTLLFAWTVCKHVKSNAIVYCPAQRRLRADGRYRRRADEPGRRSSFRRHEGGAAAGRDGCRFGRIFFRFLMVWK